MKLTTGNITRTSPETEVYESILSLDGKKILELGCGKAIITRSIAISGTDREVLALEVDRIQHEKNLLIDDLPNVRFGLAGAENIPAGDNSFDVVFMFKSLHHVPLELMGQALREIRRVLKPGGLAYISEPVFAGNFNNVLKLFHNEEAERQAAFEALQRAIETGDFALKDELFFNTPNHFVDFAEFEQRIINVTHTDHQLETGLMQEVKAAFDKYMTPDGAHFENPVRVDLLEKI